MKTKLILSVAAAIGMLAGITSATAADLAARPYTKAPVVAPVAAYDWSGFYLGVNLGGSWSDNSHDYVMPFTAPGNVFANCATPAGVVAPVPTGPNPFDLSADCSRPSSFIGGGQIGYNWQAGTWLFGLEADGAWQRLIQHSFTRFGGNGSLQMGGVANDTAYFRSEQGALGTFRGRVGYAPGPWLLYATGGLAVGNVKHSLTEVLDPGVSCPTAPTGSCRTGSNDVTKTGWTVGAGAEWMFARNWSVGAEYLYVDLGSTTVTLAPTGGFFATTSSATFEDREHIARVKLNYHFGGPVVAKY